MGLSHGLKIARQLSIFAPVCGLVPAFSSPRPFHKKKTAKRLSFFYGVGDGTRTHNAWNHNPVLCQLNYTHHILLLRKMARQKGLEPLTYCLEGSCSIQLSYWRIFYGAGDGNRTRVSSLEGWCSTIELHPHTTL